MSANSEFAGLAKLQFAAAADGDDVNGIATLASSTLIYISPSGRKDEKELALAPEMVKDAHLVGITPSKIVVICCTAGIALATFDAGVFLFKPWQRPRFLPPVDGFASYAVSNCGNLFCSRSNVIGRVPFRADVYCHDGEMAFMNWPGQYTLAVLHGGTTVICACTSGIMLLTEANDSTLQVGSTKPPFRPRVLCAFGGELAKITEKPPWRTAIQCRVFAAGDSAFVQCIETGVITMTLVPLITKQETVGKTTTVVLGTFAQMFDATVTTDFVVRVATAAGVFGMPMAGVLAKEYAPYPAADSTLLPIPIKYVAHFINRSGDLFCDGRIFAADGTQSKTFSHVEHFTSP
jgi:hypothetical protein